MVERLRTMHGRAAWLAAAALLAPLALLLMPAARAEALYCYYPSTRGGGHSFWSPDGSGGGFYEPGLFSRKLGGYRTDYNFFFGYPVVAGSAYNNPDDYGCGLEEGGQELVLPAEPTGGLEVRPKAYTDPKRPFARTYVTFKNTGALPVKADILFHSKFSDASDRTIDRTSSGDKVGDAADIWATECQDVDADGCQNTKGESVRAPELALVWERKGKKAKSADLVDLAAGKADVTFQSVDVKPGKTIALMEVTVLANNIDDANKAAKQASADPAGYGLFRGLSQAEKRKLRNF
jgi:hypothetical protein